MIEKQVPESLFFYPEGCLKIFENSELYPIKPAPCSHIVRIKIGQRRLPVNIVSTDNSGQYAAAIEVECSAKADCHGVLKVTLEADQEGKRLQEVRRELVDTCRTLLEEPSPE